MPPKTVARSSPKTPAKTFAPGPLTRDGQGKRFIVYGQSGMGKSSLALLAPKPRFIALDPGVSLLRHPVTGEPAQGVPGVETFQDVRDALHSPSLWADDETCVIDTVSVLQELAAVHVLETIPADKHGTKAQRMESYGFNKGPGHVFDVMSFILSDLDGLVRAGKNVVLISQMCPIKVPNAAGDEYLAEAPNLYDRKPSILEKYKEWADYVFRIGYEAVNVKDRKASSSMARVICIRPEIYYAAKCKGVPQEIETVSFASPADDTIWKFVFEDAWKLLPEYAGR